MRKLVIFIFVSARYTTVRSNDNYWKVNHTYLPIWKDLSNRPLPQWYDAAKIGIFIHWGVYSVPSAFEGGQAGSEWFWYDWRINANPKLDLFMKEKYGPKFKYSDFAPMFKAELFDPKEWAQLFAEAGAKYVVLTSKHHDGFGLFPSQRRDWNSVDVGPKKDIVRILSNSIRDYDMKFGVYYSLLEWFNKMYVADRRSQGRTTSYVDNIVWPDIKYLINAYKPSVLWSDGDWDLKESYWKGSQILAWLYNESPVKDDIVVNDRWGPLSKGHHGDFYTYGDRFNSRSLMPHKWENCFSLDKRSWGYRHKMEEKDIMNIAEILEEVVSTVSCGGNTLINVGPMGNGIIAPIFKRLLLRLGKWLQTNGEAIYNTSPWVKQRDSVNSNVWYTCKKTVYHPHYPTQTPDHSDIITTIYIIFLAWPNDNVLKINDLVSYLIIPEFRIYIIQRPNKYKGNCYAGDDIDFNETAQTDDETCLRKVEHRRYNNVVEVDLPERSGNHAWVLKVLLNFEQRVNQQYT